MFDTVRLTAYLLLRRAQPAAGRLLARLRGGRPAPPIGSAGFRWTIRAIVYGIALVVGLPLLFGGLATRRALDDDACRANAGACLDPQSGLLPPAPGAGSLPSTIPCRFVGVWSSIRPGSVMRVTLDDNGRYFMAPNASGAGNRAGYTGYWAVQGDKMIWRHEQNNTGEPDVNPIHIASDTRFSLTEENGSVTRFERIEAVESDKCTR